jgi:predicted heme/steroid binding protein
LKTFTKDELSKFDGREGRPAYVAYSGRVYDVTESEVFTDGDHLGHDLGLDLTPDMDDAPHGDDVLEEFRVVGEYREGAG